MSDFDFIALDVETANENYWSICQVGIAFFKDGEVINTWDTLVNPQTYFSSLNIGIHGIEEKDVHAAPTLPEMYDQVNHLITGNIVAHHMPFDRLAYHRCAEKINRSPLDCYWADSARIARDTWQEVSKRGYSLANLSALLSIPLLHHHNALDDAIAAGMIIVRANKSTNTPFDKWIRQYFDCDDCSSSQKRSSISDKDFRKLANSDPDPRGPLFGEVVVFTGELSISRMEAGQLAYKMGCNIDTGVTRNTTLLIVGDQDSRKLAGYTKSSKQRKAEDLISSGQQLRIIGEDDFFAMINY